MKINADFNQRVAIHTEQLDWQTSPMPGVSRRMLDRVGDEVARATSIVRYAPNSHFSPHIHHGGEEFIVLKGVFQDEHGDYPPNTYVRNPPQSRHQPGSEPGCVIFVKLWQFDPADRQSVRIAFDQSSPLPDPKQSGISYVPLFQDHRETVRIEYWQAGVQVELDTAGGCELLVLTGSFTERGEHFHLHGWLRLPDQMPSVAVAGSQGTQVWIKSGHLRFVSAP